MNRAGAPLRRRTWMFLGEGCTTLHLLWSALLTTVVDCKAGGACVSRWAAVCSRQRSGGALRQRQRALAQQQAASVARNRQRIALKCDTQNKQITGTGAHLTSVANSDTGAGMLRRAATLGQERGGGALRQRQRTPAQKQAVPVACNRLFVAVISATTPRRAPARCVRVYREN